MGNVDIVCMLGIVYACVYVYVKAYSVPYRITQSLCYTQSLNMLNTPCYSTLHNNRCMSVCVIAVGERLDLTAENLLDLVTPCNLYAILGILLHSISC